MIANELGTEVLEWFAEKGIAGETVLYFGIYTAPDGAVCFPYTGGVKRRYGIPSGERAFKWDAGTAPVLFNRGDLGKRTIILCEGETDTMRLWQEIPDHTAVGVVGIPGIETWNQSMVDDLKGVENILVVLDNDTDYRVSGRVDNAWRQIRADLGRKARRVNLPSGCNDLCEFFRTYDFNSFRLLAERARSIGGQSRYKVMDLSADLVPPRWVIDGMICQGDLHLLIGEMNAGKSWVTLAMAVALVEGRDTFLGHPVSRHGRVLYFDEENPEDLVLERLRRLGLTERGMANLRFVKDAGLRLDREPDTILDEALDFQPTLIVLDSLTRIHTQDENSAGAMATLFNDGIKPLAREADAAVVLIHHVNKSEDGALWKRARGSSDITSFPDSAYDVNKREDGSIKFTNFKARRKAQAHTQYLSLLDKADGSIELLSSSDYAPGLF